MAASPLQRSFRYGLRFGYEKGSPDEAVYRHWYAERYHSPKDDIDQI